MKHYMIRLSPEAQTDLVDIHDYIFERSGSFDTADRYIERINGFLSSFVDCRISLSRFSI